MAKQGASVELMSTSVEEDMSQETKDSSKKCSFVGIDQFFSRDSEFIVHPVSSKTTMLPTAHKSDTSKRLSDFSNPIMTFDPEIDSPPKDFPSDFVIQNSQMKGHGAIRSNKQAPSEKEAKRNGESEKTVNQFGGVFGCFFEPKANKGLL